MRRLLFRLALHLGASHPDELLGKLTRRQLCDWLEYLAIEPLPSTEAEDDPEPTTLAEYEALHAELKKYIK